MLWLSDAQHAAVAAACDRLVPGSADAGAADYVDGLLGVFTYDPPRIWAGGPFSGRAGGDAQFEQFFPLSRVEAIAWRTRIEGSQGMPEREFNGPVVGWQQQYRDGLAALGSDFAEQDGDEQDRRLDADPAFQHLVYKHACEGCYGAPEYGGNRDLAGWLMIAYDGDVQPRGYTDEEVAER